MTHHHRHILLILCCCWLHTALFAQTIPAERRVEWSAAGLSAAAPTPVATYTLTDYGLIPDNTTDNSAALAALLATISSGTPVRLLLPAGDYRFTQPINLKSGMVLRGECASTTRLHFDFSGNGYDAINISSSQSAAFTPITNGPAKGSTTLTVANTSGLAVGDFAEIRQQNGSWDAVPATWATYCVGQMVRITAISGTQVSIAQPLRISYTASLNPEIRRITPIRWVGVENVLIERTDAAATPPGGNNISLNYAADCWVRGVESNKSVSARMALFQSTNCEITGSYLHHAFEYTGSNTKGYGVVMGQHTGECLVQDNIFRYLRHAMSIKQGANGNVVAYNYAREGNRSELISDYAADISIHGHYPFANLCEGNAINFLQIDYTWGPAGPFNTYFRNKMMTYGLVMSAATGGGQGQNQQNFVGNETTNSAFHVPFYGQYTLTGSDHFEYGNNITGTTTPAATANLATNSYYLANNPPAFWSLNGSLPSIGLPNALGSGTNPAEQRWASGGLLTTSSTAQCCAPLTIFSHETAPCGNNTAQYSVLHTEGSTYNWTAVGGTIVAGQGSPTVTILWDNGSAGSVSVNKQD